MNTFSKNIYLLQFYSFLKRVIWPIIKQMIWPYVFTNILLVIIFFTVVGLKSQLSQDFNNLLGVLTSTIGTVIAIFFSIILIPINQIALKYSPKFLKYLRNDLFFISIFIYSTIALAYDLLFLFVGASRPIVYVAIGMFLLLIILLGLCLRHLIKVSNPYYSILLPAHREIVKAVRKQIPINYKKCREVATETYKESGVSEQSLNICLFKVDDSITNYIKENLLLIREIAVKSIGDLDLEQTKNAVQTMMSVVVNYLYDRKEYHNDDDPLMYFLYTEYKLIVEVCSKEMKFNLYPFIVDCWMRIGVQATNVNVKGMVRMGEGTNGLVIYPIQGLKDLCIRDLLEMDSYTPGKACEAMGDIGVGLMKEGYDLQATTLVEDLEKISLLADQHNIRHVSAIANSSIMRIYTSGLAFRNKGTKDYRNYPYRQINKSIDRLLVSLLQKKRSTYDSGILSPFIGWLTDPFKGINFSRVPEYGLFSTQDLTKVSLEKNIECIRANVKITETTLGMLATYEDWFFSKQAVENLYRIVLNLLSYLNPVMAKDHILFYKNHPFIDIELKEKTSSLVIEVLEVIARYIKSPNKQMFESEHIHTLFSLYFIILFEYKLRPNMELQDLFERVHKMFVVLITEYTKLEWAKDKDNLYKYYRLLVIILTENGFIDLAKDFTVPEFLHSSGGMFSSYESEFPETIMDDNWWILRPGFQVNAYYYNIIEEKLNLDKIKFH